LLDFDRLPAELADIKFDVAVQRDLADETLDHCSELVPLAKERAAAEPVRPGPRQVLQLCAALEGDLDTFYSEGARVKELVAASRVPTQAWGQDLYYEAVGFSDAAAILMSEAADSELIAEALDSSRDGHRLFNLVWARESNGRVRRFRIDTTRNAERLSDHLASKAGGNPEAQDFFLAVPAHSAIIFNSKLPQVDGATLTALALMVDRSNYFGKIASVDETLQRAIAQQDVYAMHVQAERLLGNQDADNAEHSTARDLLRRAAGAGLPESQLLLAIGCERARFECDRGESKRWALAAKRAYGDGEAKRQEFLVLLRMGQERAARHALEQAAEAGNARAMTMLAVRNEYKSEGSPAQTERLWRDAARLGDAAANSVLASRDLKTATQPAQRTNAISRLRQAAEAGSAEAAFKLGKAYATGNGVDRSAVDAARWYRVASNEGHGAAQVAYAGALLAGDGVARDMREGRMWLLRALMQDSMPAVVASAELYLQGTGVLRNAETAASYLHDAAKNGYAPAQKRYADLLWEGEGVTEDRGASIEWYEKAAAQDDPAALLRLGWIYETGAGVRVDGARSYGYYQRCEKLEGEGVGDCLNNLALTVWKGMGVPVDRPRAITLFRRSIALGSAPASCNLGDVLDAEESTPAERDEGERYIEASAEAGQARCQYLHALHLLKRDPPEARDAMGWLRRAADAGHADAQVAIVVQLFDEESGLSDPAAGLAYAEACFAAGNPRCLGKAGTYLMKEPSSSRKAKGREMLQQAALGGDEDSALHLGLLAYGPSDREPEARRWLALGGDGLAIARLARLDARAGDTESARRRLTSVHGNLLAYFQLIGVCRVADCGHEEFSVPGWFAMADMDGPAGSLRLLNGVAWAVATDVLAPRDEAHTLLEMMQPERFPLDDGWSYRDSYAGVLARAGYAARACEEQRTVVANALAEKIGTIHRKRLEQKRDAYCRGDTWDRW
jgi:TPR repeat protein